jgi:hypothetical protein
MTIAQGDVVEVDRRLESLRQNISAFEQGFVATLRDIALAITVGPGGCRGREIGGLVLSIRTSDIKEVLTDTLGTVKHIWDPTKKDQSPIRRRISLILTLHLRLHGQLHIDHIGTCERLWSFD